MGNDLKSGTTYTMNYSDFVGIDLSSSPRAVNRSRLAHGVNVWRDYESAQGQAIETFPGFRTVRQIYDKLHGMYYLRSNGNDWVVVHAGNHLHGFLLDNLIATEGPRNENPSAADVYIDGMPDADTAGFAYNGRLYLIGGGDITVIQEGNKHQPIIKSSIGGYVPTTYYHGNAYEQRNMLSNYAYEVVEANRGVDALAYWTRFLNYKTTRAEDALCDTITVYGFMSPFETNFEKNHKMTQINLAGGYENPDVDIVINGQGDFTRGAFDGEKIITSVDIRVENSITLGSRCFADCSNLKKVQIYAKNLTKADIADDAFEGCPLLERIDIYYPAIADNAELKIIDGLTHYHPIDNTHEMYDHHPEEFFDTSITLIEVAADVKAAQNALTDAEVPFGYDAEWDNKDGAQMIKTVYFNKSYLRVEDGDTNNENDVFSSLKLKLQLHPTHFSTVEKVSNFLSDNESYVQNTREAICKCTKWAIYDGRIFLSGNPDLPNTVFYSQRNLTGANDPTYFGVSNYFNDGYGNAPIVDMLSTPSMLMVMKQGGSSEAQIYYHTAAYNTDESSKNLVPRIYPSTEGSAGLGSAAGVFPGSVACNFLDDAVFLSKRGLEAVGKQALNLERTLTHRSSNVDRLLAREDLSRASIAEWKGYLVILCNGHAYLADSRRLTQHPDGSYQYEWFYLEGLGTYAEYKPAYCYLDRWPYIKPLDLDELIRLDGILAANGITDVLLYDGKDISDIVLDYNTVIEGSVTPPGSAEAINYYYTEIDEKKYLADQKGGQWIGAGAFYGATRLLSVNDVLVFGTDNGRICIVNTDKRGVSVDGRAIDPYAIDRSFYSFAGVSYRSELALRLDDCGQGSLLKSTVFGTTAARFKMMPGSKCSVKVSTNGRDWTPLGEAFNSRFDFGDMDFSDFSFTENEDHVVVFPEMTRGWIDKQYYFSSDSFQAPFGLYELSYLYRITGRIRY